MTGTPRDEDPDYTLLERARQAADADLRAFEELVRRHQSWIVADCRRMTRDDLNFEDLAQEVFVSYRAIEDRHGYRPHRHQLRSGRRGARLRPLVRFGTRDIVRNITAGFYARKILSIGKPLEIPGQRGVLVAITPTHAILESGETQIAVANASLLDNVARQ